MSEEKNKSESEVLSETMKELLSNSSLIKWVNKNSADNMSSNEQSSELLKKLKIGYNHKKSFVFMDNASISAFVNNAFYKGEKFNMVSLDQIKKVITALGKDLSEGKLIIGKDEFSPVFVEFPNGVVIISPMNDNEERVSSDDEETEEIKEEIDFENDEELTDEEITDELIEEVTK